MSLVTSLVVLVSAYASIGGLYLTVLPPSSDRPAWHWALIGIFIVLAVITIWTEIRRFMAERHKVFGSVASINKYMCRLVQSTGRTVIFSRDLSWSSEPEASQALKTKAASQDLTICLYHETSFSKELQALGANIILYGDSGHEPRSRFTIVGYGVEGSRVAVGSRQGNKQIVYEYAAGQHPAFALAEDLARIISGFKTKTDHV